MPTSEFYKTFFFLVEYNVGMFCKISDQIIFDQSQPCTEFIQSTAREIEGCASLCIVLPTTKVHQIFKSSSYLANVDTTRTY